MVIITRSGRPAAEASSSSAPLASAFPAPAAPAAVQLLSVKCWQQRTLLLKRADDSGEVSTRLLAATSGDLTLTCRQFSPHMREYVVQSTAPLLTVVDFAAVTLTVVGMLYALLVLQLRPPQVLLPLLPLVLRLLQQSQRVRAESVLCVACLGLQLRTVYAGGREHVRFLSLPRVESVVINEVISCYALFDVLCCVMTPDREQDEKMGGGAAGQTGGGSGGGSGKHGGKHVVVLFAHLRPRLAVLRVVYRGLRHVLYGELE
jgi:hypothetical protein